MREPDSAGQKRVFTGARQAGMRVAFFGGSFDPPHLGHLAVARAAQTAFKLDTVLFAPVGAQPLKPEGSSASFEQRLAMTRLAIEGEPGFAISLADAPKPTGEPNYTLETLQALRAGIGADSALYCLMGADSFFGVQRWHRAAEIPFCGAIDRCLTAGAAAGGIESRVAAGTRTRARAGRGQERVGCGGSIFFPCEPGRRPRAVLPASRTGCEDQRVRNSRGDWVAAWRCRGGSCESAGAVAQSGCRVHS